MPKKKEEEEFDLDAAFPQASLDRLLGEEVDLDDISYLCAECAEELGGVWPKDHCATFHVAECNVCGEEKSLANVGDWDWPDGKHRGMRD